MELTVDREYLLKTTAELVRIDSVNPALVPGGRGEAQIAAYIEESLRDIGMTVSIHESLPGRPNVVGTLKGRGGGRSLMLNGHTDTVGEGAMADPFSAEIRDGKMYGRGTYDMKGALGSCMAACKALVDSGVVLRGDLILAAVADEEHRSSGTEELLKRCAVDGAIVAESSEMEICLAHKGFMWLKVETLGRAVHGSRFEEGIDANIRMGRFLAELGVHEGQLRCREGHPLAGPPSLHAGKLAGGTELSTYAARCEAHIERRTIPGETEEQVLGEMQAIIDKLGADDPTFHANLSSTFAREPFAVSSDARIVGDLRRAAARVLGREPKLVGRAWWTDAALLSGAGIETVVMGPHGGGAHSDEEWVDLQSLTDLAYTLAYAATDYCG